jgi:hypothetical protein
MAVRLLAALYSPETFSFSGTHFSQRLSKLQGLVWLEGLGSLQIQDLIRTRARNLPACNTVPQPTTLPHAPSKDALQDYEKAEISSR